MAIPTPSNEHIDQDFSDSEKRARIPTLGQMICDARADQQVIRRATQQALRAWFRQSQRLNVARREYKLRGPRFLDFARRIGITDQTSAYQLAHLYQYRAKVIKKCADDAADAAKRGKCTAILAGRRHWIGFINPDALDGVAGIGSRHPTCIASWMRNSTLITTHARTRCQKVSIR